MKTIIAGSRSVTDFNLMEFAIKTCPFPVTEVVSGGARGADKLGEKLAHLCELPLTIYPADWKQYGKSAGYRRNALMAQYAEALIALWDGESRGTMHMIDLAKASGLEVHIVPTQSTESILS